MTSNVLPVVFTLAVWWLSTGVVLFIVNLTRPTYARSMVVATMVLAASFYGLVWSSEAATELGAYVAFFCGVLIWGWVEMSYYTGFVTGPRPLACPPRVKRWRRFSLALQASLYHELVIVGFAGIVFALTWGSPNQIGAWTFAILWLMRWSAKLNIFLGVPQLNLQFFPDHLRYLESFIVKRPMNALFPLSAVVSVVIAALVLARAFDGTLTAFETTEALLLGTLIVLGILEHAFLVVPLPDAVLWNWAVPKRSTGEPHYDRAAPAISPIPLPDDRSRPAHHLLSALDTVPVCGSSSRTSAPTNTGR